MLLLSSTDFSKLTVSKNSFGRIRNIIRVCVKQFALDPDDALTLEKNYLRKKSVDDKQVAQWARSAHLGASIRFVDTIIYDAQK